MNFKRWLSSIVLGLTLAASGCAHLEESKKKDNLEHVLSKAQERNKQTKFKEILNDNKKLRLFKLDNLGKVDTSEKNVKLSVAGSDLLFLFAPENEDKVFSHVKEFYEKYGVNVDVQFVNKIDYDSLDHTKHLALEFKVKPLFLDPKIKGNAERKDKTCFISPKKFLTMYEKAHESNLFLTKKERIDRVNRLGVASTIVHELGHMFGLYHSHEYGNDPVEDYMKDTPNFSRFVPNCMSYQKEVDNLEKYPIGCGLDEFQKKIIHSFLGKGKIYQALESINFNVIDFYHLTSIANNYFLSK